MHLKMPTLKFRCMRGDMIKFLKLTHKSVSPQLPICTRSNTRGNNYKLLNHTFHYDLRKHFFTARTADIWNSLPNSVVNANSVNAFKARLDKFWLHQGKVMFDFTADLIGTGNWIPVLT